MCVGLRPLSVHRRGGRRRCHPLAAPHIHRSLSRTARRERHLGSWISHVSDDHLRTCRFVQGVAQSGRRLRHLFADRSTGTASMSRSSGGRISEAHRKHESGSRTGMLKYTHKVLQSQWLFTRRASRLRGAYRHGKLIWQHHYGEATVDPERYTTPGPDAGARLGAACALAIHFPAGCGSAILRCISPRAELPLLRKRIRRRARVSGVSIVAEDLARWVRCVVDAKAPRGSMITVASGGDATLTSFALHEGRHFPARRTL